MPVYAVGGYADGYTNPIFRMMENLPGPRKALVGPWAHKYPHFASPEPRIGFLQECLRWWDQHLKGIETGIMDEPMIRAWLQEPVPPSPEAQPRPGRWISAEGWPVAGTELRSLHLSPEGLSETPDPQAAPITIASPQTAGWCAPTWCIYGVDPDGPLDQQGEAGLMTAFDTAPLAEDLEIFGFPRLYARLTSDAPQGNLAAVLSMVAPDGAATLVSFGVLNLTHRQSHAAPEPLPTGEPVDIALQLNVIGQTVPAGYRLRLALSTAYWPMIWPSPEAPTLTLAPGAVRLDLPLHDAARDVPLPEFGPPEGAVPLETETITPGSSSRTRTIDLATGIETTRRAMATGLSRHLHTDLTVGYTNEDVFRIHPSDPNSAVVTCSWEKRYARGDWRAELDATVSMRALRDTWHVTARLEARDADGVVAIRDWDERIPRDMV